MSPIQNAQIAYEYHPAALKISWKKIFVVSFLSLVLFVGVFTGFFFGYEKIYAQKIYHGIKIEDINLGGLSRDEASQIMQTKSQELLHQKYSLNFNSKIFYPAAEELGLKIDASKLLDQALALGKSGNLKERILLDFDIWFNGRTFVLKPEFDRQKLSAYIAENIQPLEKEAKNAELVIENGEAKIISSQKGIKVDAEGLIADIENAFIYKHPAHEFTIEFTETNPEVSENDLTDLKAQAQNIVSQPIVLVYENRTFLVSGKEISQWLKVVRHSAAHLEFDEEGIQNFVATAAKKIDIKPQDRKISSTDGSVIEEGRDGKKTNQAQAIAEIKKALEDVSHPRQIVLIVDDQPSGEKTVNPSSTAGLFEGKYIEINLSQQKLYLFEGENQVGVYSVSTGKWSMPTPTGTFAINNKNPRAYSRKYNLYMPYWMSFVGSAYGIHELPEWANGTKEGESHLGTPVSHGCVRLGVGPAETVYNWASIGTPVYIHK